MQNIIWNNDTTSAFIGFASAFIVAIITCIVQLYIARKNSLHSEKQLERQFKESRRQYDKKIEHLLDEQKKEKLEKANDKFQAENNRFYNGLIDEIQCYKRLLNELHYINNITSFMVKEFQSKGVHSFIDNNIETIVGGVSLPADVAKLLGSLRVNIDLYNAALNRGADSDVLEELLKRVHSLIGYINEESFNNYANAQASLKRHEIRMAERVLED